MTEEEYLGRLKQEFQAPGSPYEGYDPDEDHRYFIQWLVDRLYKLEVRDG